MPNLDLTLLLNITGNDSYRTFLIPSGRTGDAFFLISSGHFFSANVVKKLRSALIGEIFDDFERRGSANGAEQKKG